MHEIFSKKDKHWNYISVTKIASREFYVWIGVVYKVYIVIFAKLSVPLQRGKHVYLDLKKKMFKKIFYYNSIILKLIDIKRTYYSDRQASTFNGVINISNPED